MFFYGSEIPKSFSFFSHNRDLKHLKQSAFLSVRQTCKTLFTFWIYNNLQISFHQTKTDCLTEVQQLSLFIFLVCDSF